MNDFSEIQLEKMLTSKDLNTWVLAKDYIFDSNKVRNIVIYLVNTELYNPNISELSTWQKIRVLFYGYYLCFKHKYIKKDRILID